MVAKILTGFVAVLAVLVIVIAMQPSDFRIERSAVIAAPSATAFEYVNNLPKWQAWSPFDDADPQMKRIYEGPAAGIGAIYKWSGNNQVGEGSVTITESKPGELVRMRLEFIKPFKGTNNVEFTFKPQGDKTDVTWTMTGQRNFLAKAMGLVMNCEKMVGGEFEKGLSQLSAAAQTETKAPAPVI